MRNIIRITFSIMSIFWITSPIIFCALRMIGVFDYRGKDWAIFLGLSLVSFVTMFLVYRPYEET